MRKQPTVRYCWGHRRFARRVAGLALMFFDWGVTALALRAARSPQQPSQDQLQLWPGALSRCRTLCNAQHCRTRWAAGSAPAPERAAPLRAGCGGLHLNATNTALSMGSDRGRLTSGSSCLFLPAFDTFSVLHYLLRTSGFASVYFLLSLVFYQIDLTSVALSTTHVATRKNPVCNCPFRVLEAHSSSSS